MSELTSHYLSRLKELLSELHCNLDSLHQENAMQIQLKLKEMLEIIDRYEQESDPQP